MVYHVTSRYTKTQRTNSNKQYILFIRACVLYIWYMFVEENTKATLILLNSIIVRSVGFVCSYPAYLEWSEPVDC